MLKRLQKLLVRCFFKKDFFAFRFTAAQVPTAITATPLDGCLPAYINY